MCYRVCIKLECVSWNAFGYWLWQPTSHYRSWFRTLILKLYNVYVVCRCIVGLLLVYWSVGQVGLGPGGAHQVVFLIKPKVGNICFLSPLVLSKWEDLAFSVCIKLCLFFNFWMLKCTIMANKTQLWILSLKNWKKHNFLKKYKN